MTIWDFLIWTFWIYITIACISIFITIIMDVFRAQELGGGAKALWVLFLVFVPFLAAFIYLIVRGSKMSARQADRARGAQLDTDAYIRGVASSTSPSAEIESAKGLLDAGTISQAEFDTLKARALASV